MIILGIDPGIASVGYGVIDYSGNKFTPICYDTFRTPAGMELPQRLEMIYDFLIALLDRFKPDSMAVEELFFSKNITTGIPVAHGRGMVLLASAKTNTPIYEYKPMQVKLAVVGYGKAEKKQVQQMVKMLLNLKEVPRPDDTADALAIAICHAHSARSRLFGR